VSNPPRNSHKWPLLNGTRSSAESDETDGIGVGRVMRIRAALPFGVVRRWSERLNTYGTECGAEDTRGLTVVS
jgi:hypothetical protein